MTSNNHDNNKMWSLIINSLRLPGREYELPIHGPDGPENEADKDANGEGGRGKHHMTQPAHRRVFAGKIREQTDGEVQQLEDHVEEGEVLGLAAEQLPGGGQLGGQLHLVQVVVDGVGKAWAAGQVEEELGGGYAHLTLYLYYYNPATCAVQIHEEINTTFWIVPCNFVPVYPYTVPVPNFLKQCSSIINFNFRCGFFSRTLVDKIGLKTKMEHMLRVH